MHAGLRQDASVEAVGVSAAAVGYASSVAVVVAGLEAAGATPAQVSSALAGLGLVLAVATLALSVPTRVPVSVVWTTPGLGTAGSLGPVDGGFAAVVGAFVLRGALLALTGLVPAVARLLGRLPPALSAAVLASVLLPFCLAPFDALGVLPAQAGAVVGTWERRRSTWP